MRSVSPRLQYLNTWSPVGVMVWRGLGDASFMEELYQWGELWEFITTFYFQLLFFSFFFSWGWKFSLWASAQSHALPPWWAFIYLELLTQINKLFLKWIALVKVFWHSNRKVSNISINYISMCLPTSKWKIHSTAKTRKAISFISSLTTYVFYPALSSNTNLSSSYFYMLQCTHTYTCSCIYMHSL